MALKSLPIAAFFTAMTIATSSLAQSTLDTSGISMGEKIEAPIGGLYERELQGDWSVMCVKMEEGNDPCHMGQLLFDQNGNNVAEVNIMPMVDQEPLAAVMNIVTPLETLLTDQVTIDVDSENVKRYPYSYCNVTGCLSRIGISVDDLVFYKKGNVGFITITPATSPNERVVLQMSLTGFTSAFGAIDNKLEQ